MSSHEFLNGEEVRRRKSMSEWCSVRKTQLPVLAFDGRVPRAKECGQPLEAGERGNKISPRAYRNELSSANTLIFLGQCDLFQASDK